MVPEEVLNDAIVATNSVSDLQIQPISKQVSNEQQVIISTSAVLNSCQIMLPGGLQPCQEARANQFGRGPRAQHR